MPNVPTRPDFRTVAMSIIVDIDNIPEADLASPDVQEGKRDDPQDTSLPAESQGEPPQADAR